MLKAASGAAHPYIFGQSTSTYFQNEKTNASQLKHKGTSTSGRESPRSNRYYSWSYWLYIR
jgi:hypothetical protein